MRKRGHRKERVKPELKILHPKDGDKITVNEKDGEVLAIVVDNELFDDKKKITNYLQMVRAKMFSFGRDVFLIDVKQNGKAKTGTMKVGPNRRSLLGFEYRKIAFGKYIVIV